LVHYGDWLMDPNAVAPVNLRPVQDDSAVKPVNFSPVQGAPQEDPMLYTDPQKALANAAEGGPSIMQKLPPKKKRKASLLKWKLAPLLLILKLYRLIIKEII
jgi:hypothetical protein